MGVGSDIEIWISQLLARELCVGIFRHLQTSCFRTNIPFQQKTYVMKELILSAWIVAWLVSCCCLAAIQLRHTGGRLSAPLSTLTKDLDATNKKLAKTAGVLFLAGAILLVISSLM